MLYTGYIHYALTQGLGSGAAAVDYAAGRREEILHMFFDQTVLDLVARALVLSCIGLIWVVFTVRIVGLRAFSKMTAFDFVVTVATGSLLAGAAQATDWSGFAQPCLAIAFLLIAQYITARMRQSSEKAAAIMMNCPTLLMRDSEILHDALHATRVSEDDLIAKLREANVLNLEEVRAVVLESTGDISVLHGDSLAETLLKGVENDC